MDIARILKENNIVPKKELDQFFLQDERLLDEEVRLANLSENDTVLEIGAGIGNLTRKIAEKSKVIAIEKDYSFRAVLKNIPSTNIIFGDALELLESLRKSAESGKPRMFNKIISNIPYSITQNLIIELLRHRWDTAVLCVQKEFADKLMEKEKISLAVSECCSVKTAGDVSASAFYPTAVESAVIVLKQKRLLDPEFWDFLRLTYKNRNKDVKNVVEHYPARLAKKKIHQLTLEEIKQLCKMNKSKRGSVQEDT